MKAGVKNGDLRYVHYLFAGLDALEVCGVVERAEFEALSDSDLDVLGDEHGAGEFLAAVEHSVTDSAYLIGRGNNAVLGVNERIEHKLDGCAVIGDGAG